MHLHERQFRRRYLLYKNGTAHTFLPARKTTASKHANTAFSAIRELALIAAAPKNRSEPRGASNPPPFSTIDNELSHAAALLLPHPRQRSGVRHAAESATQTLGTLAFF